METAYITIFHVYRIRCHTPVFIRGCGTCLIFKVSKMRL